MPARQVRGTGRGRLAAYVRSMDTEQLSPFARLLRLTWGSLSPPPGRRRIGIALVYGVLCHVILALAVLWMIIAMFFGMSLSFGSVPAPWSWLTNAMLIVQLPLVQSVFMTPRGGALLGKLAPAEPGKPLATKSYAIIAVGELLA